jgi:diguanylate cyclase (GGDEF)-like protein/PAS domain S-box-containing protein
VQKSTEYDTRWQAIITLTPDGVVCIDATSKLIEFNPAAESIFGWKKQEVIGRSMVEILIPEHHRMAHQEGLARFVRTGEAHILNRHIEITALRRDGSEFPIELSITATQENGCPVFTAYIRDISERKKTEVELRIAATAFNSRESMFITDANGVIQRVNYAFTEVTGYSAEEAVGQKPSMLKSGRHDTEFYRALHGCLRQDGHWQGEIWDRRKSGEVYPGWQTITAVTAPDGRVTHYVSAFSDISKSKEAEKQILNLAFYDPLTQLPNRRLLIDRLQQALVANVRNKCQGALLFVDLDKFKELNDTHGYDIGDLLLEVTASRLKACIRESDTAARLGGDEFIVLLEDLDPDEPTAATQAETVGEKILKSIRQPYNLKGREYYITASIGATLLRGSLRTSDEMLRRSDIGLYQAKIAGRNTMHFYDPALQALVMARVAIEADLRNAACQPQSHFVLYYQAQVDASGNLIGAEALVRWQHRERGLVSPAEFIPLAEETGLILPLGHWVLETACIQLAKWRSNSGTRHLQLAVNVSARQFHQPDFVEQICAVLQKTAIDPGKLKLELTESMLVDDIADVISKMGALKKMGLRFSMDDFGTGYSSLAYLSKLPLDQLKIDQSFVRNLNTQTSDTVIVQTIVGMAHNLGMEVIAEGVETEAQREFLEQNGCLLYQGYLFSKPLPLEEFEQLASRSNTGQAGWHRETPEVVTVREK